MAYDVRSIANFVLDISDELQVAVSNLSVNKLVYFLHCAYLVKFSKPLVAAKIEAWPRGPVFRELYHEFKFNEERPIAGRAHKIDAFLGRRVPVKVELSQEDEIFLKEKLVGYLKLNDWQLVALSHVKGGPWDQVWNHDSLTNASMQISNERIQSWYANTERH